MAWERNFALCIEICVAQDTPDLEVLQRWLGESVKATASQNSVSRC